VPYSLRIDPERVTRYLRDYPALSRACRVRLFAHLHDDLCVHGDVYRQEADRRLSPGSEYFWFHLLLWDHQGDGRARQFSFVVNDAAAVHGVLQVEYVQVAEGT
jgi:hypothetical protein